MTEGAHKHNLKYQLRGIPFTLRELDIFACIVSGRSSRKSIANILKISPATVASYMRVIMQKLKCSSVEHVRSFIELSGQEEKLRDNFYTLIRKENKEDKLLGNNGLNFSIQQSNIHTFWSLTVFTRVKNFILILFKKYYISIACISIFALVCLMSYIRTSFPNAQYRSELIVPEDKFLLKRSSLITQISRELYKPSFLQNNISVVTLVGIGGAGKTTLARLITKKHNGVAWEINAETKTTLMKSFRELAYYSVKTKEDQERIEFIQSLSGETERQFQILLFIKDKMRSLPGWLLIYDNIESLETIKESFPFDSNVWGNGNVIITTRNENINIGKHVKIEELQESEMLELFQSTSQQTIELNNEKERLNVLEFLKKLPPYPLDIVIAGKYLNTSKNSQEEYLLNMSEKTAQHEHRDVLLDDSTYTRTRYDIIDMSLNQLIKKNPQYIDLLFLIIHVDLQNIPINLCEKVMDKKITREFIRQMKNASLLFIEKVDHSHEPVICLHRSIQTCIETWLKNRAVMNRTSMDKFFERLILICESYIHDGIRLETYDDLYKLLPHLERLMTRTNIPQESLRILQASYGCVLTCLEIYTLDTQKYIAPGLEIMSKENDYRRVFNLHYYGYILGYIGQYARSAYYLEQCMEIFRKRNANGIEYFNVMNHLSIIYRVIGKYKESKKLINDGYKVKELYPKNYRALAENIAQDGLILRDKGNYQEALRYMNNSIHILSSKQKIFYTRFQQFYWLYTIYVELGYFHRALKGLKVYYDAKKDYFYQCDVKGYIAVCYYNIGELHKALKLLEEVYIISKKINYICNYNVFKGYLPILGRIYTHFAFYDKARKILEECLEYSEKLYGKEKFQSARTICYLGELDMAEGNLEKAEQNMQRSYRLLKEQDHTDMYIPLESLSTLYFEKYKIAKTKKDRISQETFYKKSQDYLREASKIIHERFPSDSDHIIRIKEKSGHHVVECNQIFYS